MQKLEHFSVAIAGFLGVLGWLFLVSPLPARAQTWSNPSLGGSLGVNYNGSARSGFISWKL
jgi:hypothetical protein